MKLLKRTLPALVLALLMTVSAGAVSYMPKTTAAIASPDFWIGRQREPEAVLMTPEEISAVNEHILAAAEDTKVRDIFSMPDTMDTKALVAALQGFEITGSYYIGGKPVERSYYETARSNMQDPAAAENRALRYGLVCKNTDLKAYPFAEILSDAADDPEFDAFQSNKLLTGDGVVIAAQSRDGAWYYVYTRSFSGWAAAGDIAVCTTKELWKNYLTAKDFLIVTGSKVSLERSAISPETSGLTLTIGSKLPLAAAGTRTVQGRIPFENHVVLLPTRAANGACVLKETPIPLNRDVHEGYLPYTRENLLTQLFKEQGDRYGWGGMLSADDCTSFVVNVYRCFGLYLPNGRWMQFVPDLTVTDLSGYSDAQKRAVLTSLPAGSILQFHGHVMAYLGQTDNRQYVISALGNAVLGGDASASRIRTVTVNTLDVKRANGHTWLQELYFALSVETPKFTDLAGRSEEETILSLARQGIVMGSGGAFSPDAPLTPAAAVKLLSRAFMLDESVLAPLFKEGVTAAAVNLAAQTVWTERAFSDAPPLLADGASLTRGAFCVYLDALMTASVPAPAETESES